MRIRTKSFLMCSVIVVLCLTLLTGGTLSQSAKGTKISIKPHTNEDIVEMYQEIINLRQQALADTEKLLEIGRGGVLGFTDARVKVSEARIQLSQFQGKHDLIVKELRNIVQFYTMARKSLITEIEMGQRSPQGLYELEITLLETKIRLARATQ